MKGREESGTVVRRGFINRVSGKLGVCIERQNYF